MKKVLVFLGIIVVLSALIIALTTYQNNKKLANNPYPTDDLHPETIQLLDDPNYQNLIMPDELAQSLHSDGTETVYFFSPLCKYCREVSPVIVPLADELGVDLKLFNVLEFPEEAEQYDLEGVPSLVHFKNGKEVTRFEGAGSEEEYREWFLSLNEK